MSLPAKPMMYTPSFTVAFVTSDRIIPTAGPNDSKPPMPVTKPGAMLLLKVTPVLVSIVRLSPTPAPRPEPSPPKTTGVPAVRSGKSAMTRRCHCLHQLVGAASTDRIVPDERVIAAVAIVRVVAIDAIDVVIAPSPAVQRVVAVKAQQVRRPRAEAGIDRHRVITRRAIYKCRRDGWSSQT